MQQLGKAQILAMLFAGFFAPATWACPELITCKAEEQMTVEKDAHGCNVVTCLTAQANQVDEYYQDIPVQPKPQLAETKATASDPVAQIQPITGSPAAAKEPSVSQVPVENPEQEKIATENPALATPVAEPESQKQPVVEESPGAVANKGPESSVEPSAEAGESTPSIAPEKAPRADTPAQPVSKQPVPTSAI